MKGMNRHTGLRIYVAGPYSAPTERERLANVLAAIDLGIALYQKGHYPYVPHLTHYVDLRAQESGIHLEWEDYISWDLPWLEGCDALFYIGGSKGADLELDVARKLGKTIFTSIEDVPVVDRDRGAHISRLSRS